jgi:hypothetical protein
MLHACGLATSSYVDGKADSFALNVSDGDVFADTIRAGETYLSPPFLSRAPGSVRPGKKAGMYVHVASPSRDVLPCVHAC